MPTEHDGESSHDEAHELEEIYRRADQWWTFVGAVAGVGVLLAGAAFGSMVWAVVGIIIIVMALTLTSRPG